MKKNDENNHKNINRMYLKVLSIASVLFLVIAFLFLAGCSSPDPKALYEQKCGSCHGLEVVEQATYSGDQWGDVVKRMQGMTTTITDDEAAKITDYLENQA